jgi:hypothetical protein
MKDQSLNINKKKEQLEIFKGRREKKNRRNHGRREVAPPPLRHITSTMKRMW